MVCQLTVLLSSTVRLWHGEHHERASPFPGLVRIPIICSFIRGVSSRQAVRDTALSVERLKVAGLIKDVGSVISFELIAVHVDCYPIR